MKTFFEEFRLSMNQNNRFQATSGQIQALLNTQIPFPLASVSQWLDFCDQTGITQTLFFDGEDRATIEDQSRRAISLAETFWQGEYQVLVMMDGHGRMLHQILRAFQTWGVDIDNIQIYIVDLDETTHKWHQAFFPNNVISIKGDIITMLNQHLQEDPQNHNKVLPYLNFCGLHNQQKRVFDLVEAWKGKGDVVLSFSLMGQSQKGGGGSKWSKRHLYRDPTKVMGLVGQIHQKIKQQEAALISQRNWGETSTIPFFITYQFF